MTVYERLETDFPDLVTLLRARADVGMASYKREFSADLKKCWIRDAEEELGDALIYIEAEIELTARKKRRNSDEYHNWLELRGARRTIARVLEILRDVRTSRKSVPCANNR